MAIRFHPPSQEAATQFQEGDIVRYVNDDPNLGTTPSLNTELGKCYRVGKTRIDTLDRERVQLLDLADGTIKASGALAVRIEKL